MRIGTLASQPVRQALVTFLRGNQDVFAWSHEDMPGIDPSIIVHKLNVSPLIKAIAEKVQKLQEADFVQEMYYID